MISLPNRGCVSLVGRRDCALLISVVGRQVSNSYRIRSVSSVVWATASLRGQTGQHGCAIDAPKIILLSDYLDWRFATFPFFIFTHTHAHAHTHMHIRFESPA